MFTAGAPVLMTSTIAAKQQHPKRGHLRVPALGRGLPAALQPNPLGASTLGSGNTHIYSLALVQLVVNNLLGFQSQREISLQSNCDLMGAFRGFSEEEVTNA